MAGGQALATALDCWQGQNVLTGVFTVRDPDGATGQYASLTHGQRVLGCWDDIEEKYKTIDGPGSSSIRWAYATTDWVNAPLNGSYVPCEAATGKDGASAGGDLFNVYLPRHSGSVDPNVRQGAIIAYQIAEDGHRVCVSDYLDDYIGAIKIHSGSVTSIPAGWQHCDGTNGTHNLREKFVLGAFGDAGGVSNFDGQENGTTVGSSGGRRFTLPFPIIYETLVTEPTHLDIWASPGQTIPTSETSLNLSGTLTASGHMKAAKADIYVIDPLRVQEVVSTFAEAMRTNSTGTSPSAKKSSHRPDRRVSTA